MANPANTPTKSERRTTIRHPSRQKNPARLTRATGEGPWLVRIRNISAEGIGLIANHPFKRGMLLTIELPTKTGKLGLPKQIKITHASPQGSNGWWVFGGVFSNELSKDELESLL